MVDPNLKQALADLGRFQRYEPALSAQFIEDHPADALGILAARDSIRILVDQCEDRDEAPTVGMVEAFIAAREAVSGVIARYEAKA